MKIRDGYALKEVGGEFVALYIGDGEDKLSGIIELNSMAAYIWQKLEAGCTEDELIKAVLTDYEVEEALAKKDIAGILAQMKENDLLDY